jgi:predicted nucleic-acid-binding Zn-ribbon protein
MPSECPKCSGRMEEGFTLDHTRNGQTAAKWVEGQPQKSFWVGVKAPSGATHPIATFRCSRCGYLESYALEGRPGRS